MLVPPIFKEAFLFCQCSLDSRFRDGGAFKSISVATGCNRLQQLLLAYPFCQGKRFAHGVVFDSIAIVVHYHFPVCLLVW